MDTRNTQRVNYCEREEHTRWPTVEKSLIVAVCQLNTRGHLARESFSIGPHERKIDRGDTANFPVTMGTNRAAWSSSSTKKGTCIDVPANKTAVGWWTPSVLMIST